MARKVQKVSWMSDNTDQLFRLEVRALEKMSKIDRYHKLLIYQNYLQYYTNFVQVEGDEDLKRIWPNLMAHLFWNSHAAITKIGDTPVAVAFKDAKYGYDGYVKEAKISHFNSLFNWDCFNGGRDLGFKKDLYWSEKKITREDSAFFKSSIFGLPLFVGLDTYIDPFLDLYNLLPTELKNAVSKLILPIPDKHLKNENYVHELNRIMDKSSGKLVGFVPEDLFTKNVIELRSKGTISEEIINTLKYLHNYAYQMTGRIFNASEKDERNLSQEVSLNTLQFHVVRNSLLSFLEQGVSDYNRVFGRNASLKLLEDLEQEKQVKYNKNGGENNEIRSEKGETDKDSIRRF